MLLAAGRGRASLKLQRWAATQACCCAHQGRTPSGKQHNGWRLPTCGALRRRRSSHSCHSCPAPRPPPACVPTWCLLSRAAHSLSSSGSLTGTPAGQHSPSSCLTRPPPWPAALACSLAARAACLTTCGGGGGVGASGGGAGPTCLCPVTVQEPGLRAACGGPAGRWASCALLPGRHYCQAAAPAAPDHTDAGAPAGGSLAGYHIRPALPVQPQRLTANAAHRRCSLAGQTAKQPTKRTATGTHSSKGPPGASTTAGGPTSLASSFCSGTARSSLKCSPFGRQPREAQQRLWPSRRMSSACCPAGSATARPASPSLSTALGQQATSSCRRSAAEDSAPSSRCSCAQLTQCCEANCACAQAVNGRGECRQRMRGGLAGAVGYNH
jgi:hypothetical protein